MYWIASVSVIVLVVAVVSGIIIGFILKQVLAAREIKSSKKLMVRIAEEAKKEAETIKKRRFFKRRKTF